MLWMLNFNIKFVKSTKKQVTTNMLNLKKKKIATELQWAFIFESAL